MNRTARKQARGRGFRASFSPFPALLLAGGLMLIGCDDDEDTTPTAPAPAPAPTPEPAPAPEPAPPPPEPDPQATPFVASVTVPDGETAFEPDDDDDPETATALPNAGISVGVTAPALIQPLFLPATTPRLLAPGEQQPFGFVEWRILQSALLEQGAAFALTRVTIAAGQQPVPTSDVLYFACGPFSCTEPAAAMPSGPPAITEADSTCAEWNPTATMDVGVVDNRPEFYEAAGPRGIDFGWRYSAGVQFTAEHAFGNQSRGEPQSVGSQPASSTLRPLGVGTLPRTAAAPGRVLNRDVVCPDDGRPVEQPDRSGDNAHGFNFGDRTSYVLYTETSAGIQQPDGCFTFPMADKGGLFSEYVLTLTPTGGAVWGEIAWEAFEDLSCAPASFRARNQVDVCALLEEEVETLPTPEAVAAVLVKNDEPLFSSEERDNPVDDMEHNYLMGLNLDFRKAQRRRFTAMWYLAGPYMQNLYDPIFDQTEAPSGNRLQNSHYYQVVTGSWELRDPLLDCPYCGNTPWQTPEDFSRVNAKIAAEPHSPRPPTQPDLAFLPLAGDFGKVDTLTWTNSEDEQRVFSFVNGPDNLPDNYMRYRNPSGTGDLEDEDRDDFLDDLVWDGLDCSPSDGGSAGRTNLCDSSQEWLTSVTFVDGWDLGCEVEKSYTVSCDWDSDGGRRPDPARAHPLVLDDFLSCTVQEN